MTSSKSSSGGIPTRSSSRLQRAPPQPPLDNPNPRTTRAKRATPAPSDPKPSADERRALASRENSLAPSRTLAAVEVPSLTSVAAPKKNVAPQPNQSVEREAIKAYLRIRPAPAGLSSISSYLSDIKPTSVVFTNPTTHQSRIARLRPTEPKSSTYQFTRVFPSQVSQTEFFSETTLPLINDLLNGESGLVFAYGVSNSGKTFTVQGDDAPGQQGILPRTVDVVFNSIEGLHSNAPLRPVRLASVELDSGAMDLDNKDASNTSLDTAVTPDFLAAFAPENMNMNDRDDTSVVVDRNHEYAVWVSYAEIYQEKIFDLLEALPSDLSSPNGPSHTQQSSGLSRSNTSSGLSALSTSSRLSSSPSKRFSNNFAALVSLGSDKVPTVTRKTLKLATDAEGGCKYILGLRETRVNSAAEAKAVIAHGQMNRKVFGTLANSQSSRSHAVFTIKVIKVHKACPNDPDSVILSRLSIVDLAGSERIKNTLSSGDRLKEGASINKSLMTLGLCMDTMRKNQHRLMDYLSGRGSHERTAPKTKTKGNDENNGKTLSSTASGKAVKLDSLKSKVPFVYSRLTELFQDFFEGTGKAVMIVNLNPYSTGYDENVRVMEFAALASEITTTSTKSTVPTTVIKPQPPSRFISSLSSGKRISLTTRTVAVTPRPSESSAKAGSSSEETLYNVVEEDEEGDEDGEDPLIDKLFNIIEELKEKLYDAELRYAMASISIREEVAEEYEERIREMEETFRQRRTRDEEEYESKMDRKIDILYRAGAIGKKSRPDTIEEEDEELNVEEALAVLEEEATSEHEPPSPLAFKGKIKAKTLLAAGAQESDSESALTELEEDEEPDADEVDVDMEDQYSSVLSNADDAASDEEWTPTNAASQEQLEEDADELENRERLKRSIRKSLGKSTMPKPRKSNDSSTSTRVSEDGHKSVSLKGKRKAEADEVRSSSNARAGKKSAIYKRPLPAPLPAYDDSIDEIPVVKYKSSKLPSNIPGPVDDLTDDNTGHESTADAEPHLAVVTTKKKKRQLGKKSAMTEDQILQVAQEVEKDKLGHGMRGSVRRMG